MSHLLQRTSGVDVITPTASLSEIIVIGSCCSAVRSMRHNRCADSAVFEFLKPLLEALKLY